MDLVAGFMDAIQRGAREFELAAGFERDMTTAQFKCDEIAVLGHRLPAEALQLFQKGVDAALALVGQGPEGVAIKHEFLVLGTQAPTARRLAGVFEVFDELAAIRDRRAAGL